MVDTDDKADFSDSQCLAWSCGDSNAVVLDGYSGLKIAMSNIDADKQPMGKTDGSPISGNKLEIFRNNVTALLSTPQLKIIEQCRHDYEAKKGKILNHPLFARGWLKWKKSVI